MTNMNLKVQIIDFASWVQLSVIFDADYDATCQVWTKTTTDVHRIMHRGVKFDFVS